MTPAMLDMTTYAAERGVTDAMRAAFATRTDLMCRLYDLRAATGLTESAYAARIGVSTTDVQRVEQGDFEGVTVESLARYATAAGATLTVTTGVGEVPTAYTLTPLAATA
jgi:DNA-binding transcriptional regulator YiaG